VKEEQRGVDIHGIHSLHRSFQTQQTLEATSMAARLPTCWPVRLVSWLAGWLAGWLADWLTG